MLEKEPNGHSMWTAFHDIVYYIMEYKFNNSPNTESNEYDRCSGNEHCRKPGSKTSINKSYIFGQLRSKGGVEYAQQE